MTEDKDLRQQIMEIKELMMSMVIQTEALTMLLDSKNILSKNELMEEMKKLHTELLQAKGKPK